MAQPIQYMFEETLPSLFGDEELRAAHRWPLSDRERTIVEKLGKKIDKP